MNKSWFICFIIIKVNAITYSFRTKTLTNGTETLVDSLNGSTLKESNATASTLITTKDDSWVEAGNHLNRSMSGPDCLERIRHPTTPESDQISITSSEYSTADTSTDEVVLRRGNKAGSTAIKRRPGKRLSRSKIKRRCSINGHFYDRETSFFTPPHGSQMSVWVTSLVNTQEVINLMLEKYKVDSDSRNFALFVIRDNGGKYNINN